MSVHYKFKSTLDYDTVSFDGLHISVADLKKAIFHQKRIGKNTDFDLQITNAQTKEDYVDDNALIAKNTSLIVARVPITVQQKKSWDRSEPQPFSNSKEESNLGHAVDLTRLDGSEEDKIRAMMTQSTQDYDPSNYMKIRGANQSGDLPPNYLCYKCHQPGHWIKNCPLGLNQEPIEIKKSTGIPRSFMVPVEGPLVPGAMMTPTGQYAVPAIDHQAYKEGKKERPPFFQDPEPVAKKPEIPEDLLCTICKDLLTDAVMIPCCGNSFCDECIRTFLLESEDHECPDCNEKDVSPETLIPNRFLRNAVMTFKNETGYAKRQSYRSLTQTTSPIKKETEKKENPVVSADNDSKEPPTVTSTSVPPEPSQPVTNPIERLSQTNPDEDSEVVPPPPPGTEPLLPILPLINKSPGNKNEPNKEKKDDNYEYEESKLPRERRPSFGKENNRERNNDNGRRVENIKPMNRRRSLSPRHSHHSDYITHNPSIPHMGNQAKGYQSSSANFPRYSSNVHYESEIHRTNEDRPGTPTVDEPHLHLSHNVHQSHSSVCLYPPGEDRMAVLPPPNYNQPPPSIPPHNPPLLPDPYMGQRMPMYPHQQAPHYGMTRYDRPPFPQSGFRHQGARNYAGPPRPLRGMHHVNYRGIQPPPPELGRNYHNGNPTGVIDDPLEAFERMLREKDERDRRLGKRRRSRTRSRSRSYSRSRSRSFARRSPLSSRMSRSRSPAPKRRSSRTPLSLRQRSRTPKRRSRSGSFSISRSRSYSRSQSPRGGNLRSRERERDRDRDFPSRYRSPVRSPIRFQRDRDRESARSRESRERHNSYYNDMIANDNGFKDRDRDIISNKDKSSSRYSSRNSSMHHNIPPLMLSLNTGGHPPLMIGASSERKDYYESYNRYPGSSNERLSSPRESHHKRIDEVAPPGTEGYYDLVPPGVDYPEKPNKDDRDRFRVKDADNQIKDSNIDSRDRIPIRDDRMLKEYDDRFRERDDRNRRGSDRDHDRENHKEKEDRDRLNPLREREDRYREKDGKDKKDRDDKYRDRKDDDRFIDKKEHERERYRDDRDRHKFDERNRNKDRERKERDYELKEDRERQDRYDKQHFVDRKKFKRSSSPYLPKNRNEVKGSSPERLKKKDKSCELKPDDKKKEKKIKDKKKKKDSEEKEKKKKKKKDKKLAQKETEKMDIIGHFNESEKTIIDSSMEAVALSNIKRSDDDDQANNGNSMKNTNILPPTTLKTEFENKSLMINPEPPELRDNNLESDSNVFGGINPPNPNFEPILDVKTEIKPIDRLYSDLDNTEINTLITDKYSLLPNVRYESDSNNCTNKSPLTVEKEAGSPEQSDTLMYESRSSSKKDEVLAPMPELSKWERDDNGDKLDQLVNTMSRVNELVDESKSTKVVTSEVIKRAENAIFQKAINAIRPIEIKKISENRKILYQNPEPKVLELDIDRETRKNVNVTINIDKNERNVEITELSKKGKLDRSKFKISSETYSPTRLSAKERLGEKVDDDKEKRSTTAKTFADKREHNKSDNFSRSRSPKFILDKKLSPFTDRSTKSESKNSDSDDRKVFFNEHRVEQTESDQIFEKSDMKSEKYDVAEKNSDNLNNKSDLISARNERESLRRIHTSPRSSKNSEDSMKLNFLKRKKDEEDDKKDEKKMRNEKKRKKEHRSRSKSKERKKRKDKKHKKDKSVEKKQKYKDIGSKRDRSFGIEDIQNLESFNSSQMQNLNKKQRKNPKFIIDRKRSALDESSFEPDYSASDSNSDNEEAKLSPKKPKLDESKLNTEKEIDIKLIKRKARSSSTEDNSSSSDSSLSDSESSEDSPKKKKKKHKKHRKHKSSKKSSSSDSDSDSDYSDSSSNDEKYKKKSKKSKSKSKQSKKKKKSKHK
ncbi:E3 ubiquitin-protein ligase RBBP6 [Chelonus insularis]|uniref:E3 ubiquitin-protein ligase RBBP6 n=1 Tax=Chelonus insularis TaxID=460826 RepID=UPI001589C116|nr:E3 ubiquitin-protein ligase RBBP6 [Chelonus insularis]